MKSARVSTPVSLVPSLGDGLGCRLQTYDKKNAYVEQAAVEFTMNGESWAEEFESGGPLQPYWSSNVGDSALDSPSSDGAARRVDADAFLTAVQQSVPTTTGVTAARSSPWAWDIDSAELGSDSPFVSAFDNGPTDVLLPDERAAEFVGNETPDPVAFAGPPAETAPHERGDPAGGEYMEKRQPVMRELSFIAQEAPSGPMNFKAILVVVVVAVALAAGGAWWWLSKNTAEPSTARELKTADFAVQTAPATSRALSSSPHIER